MIQFINEYPIYSLILALIFLEVISYSTWNNQDYEQWVTEFKTRISGFSSPVMLPLYLYLIYHYFG